MSRFDDLRPHFGLPTFDRFPQFSALLRFAEQVLSMCRRKPQKAIKVGHLSVPAFRVRAYAIICDNRQNTLDPLTFRRKPNTADARPQMSGSGSLVSHQPMRPWAKTGDCVRCSFGAASL